MPSLCRLVPVAAVLAMSSAVGIGTPAAALSCVGAETVLAEAEQVFTGRIVDSRDGSLLVAVDEVWHGEPVEHPVWLDVDLPGWSAWSDRDGSIPDGYSSPRTWVFAPADATVSPCTAWPADSPEVEPLTPANPIAATTPPRAREQVPEPASAGWLTEAGVAGGAAGAGALATLAVLFRRRRS